MFVHFCKSTLRLSKLRVSSLSYLDGEVAPAPHCAALQRDHNQQSHGHQRQQKSNRGHLFENAIHYVAGAAG